MKWINFFLLLLVVGITMQTYKAQKDFDARSLKLKHAINQIDALNTGIKAMLEADAQNFMIDSVFQHFHGNVWVPRDKFLLDKQSQASADKARNLLQVLDQWAKVDNIVIDSKTSFTEEPTKTSKPQVSFSKK